MSQSEARLSLVAEGSTLLGVMQNEGADVQAEAWRTLGQGSRTSGFALLVSAPPAHAVDSLGMCILDWTPEEAGRLFASLVKYAVSLNLTPDDVAAMVHEALTYEDELSDEDL
jgi:hypothetical protein